jgi:hypothetical protein
VPKLSRPHCFPCKARFTLELSDIPMVRDILDVFRSIAMFSHDHVVKFMSKLVL